ncbi:MAG TPA: hypothetical protein VMU07_00125 [Candidatus Paceibacterota bacterium]|nr:hypothetical protein [Candidatus Paceibacterota bacterium]
MSKTAIWVTLAVVVVIVGAGIWWATSMNQAQSPVAANNQPVQSAQPAQTAGTSNTSQNQPQPTDNSDQAILQEMSSANTQMNSFNSDSADIASGLNDQPVQQSQF